MTRTQATETVMEALEANQSRLRAFVERRAAPQHVEDVLQAAALRALEKAESLAEPDRALAWLYQVHRSTLADSGRKIASLGRWEDRSVDTENTPAEATEEHCDCSSVQAKGLKDNYAQILELVDLKGENIAEVSERLGISQNNVLVRLHRARAALRKTMLQHCGVSSSDDCDNCRCAHDGCCSH
jgi:RNA polymerase sigma-70 factor (ECF subfamily)